MNSDPSGDYTGTPFFKPGGSFRLKPKQQQLLLIIAVAAVPVIIFFHFLKWKTAEIYGDDLHMYFTHEGLTSLWDKLNMPVFYGKFRPVHGVVTHLLIAIFKKHTGAYFLFNIGVQSLNTLLFAILVNLFLQSPFLSLLLGLLIGLSRFAFFNVTQFFNGGSLEGLALTFFLIALFFIIRVLLLHNRTVSLKQRDLIWAFVAANLSLYTHERYIVLIPFMILLILLYPGLRVFSVKQKVIFSLIGIASIALNVALKKYIFGMPFLVGTGGVNISLSFSSIWTYFTEGFLSIFQVNYGPEYLIGIKFTALPVFDKILVWALLGSFATILVLYINRIRKAFLLKQKEEIAVFTIFLSLGVLFFIFLIPAIITIRLEQRWLQASFAVFILMIGLAWSRIPVKNRNARTWVIAAFVLAFSIVNFSYLNNGDKYMYLVNAGNIAGSFKQAINNGTIPASAGKLYIREDEDSKVVINWAIQGGLFFKFYQDKPKEVVFIDSSFKLDAAQPLDTLKDRVLNFNGAVTDITNRYVQMRKTVN